MRLEEESLAFEEVRAERVDRGVLLSTPLVNQLPLGLTLCVQGRTLGIALGDEGGTLGIAFGEETCILRLDRLQTRMKLAQVLTLQLLQVVQVLLLVLLVQLSKERDHSNERTSVSMESPR